MSSKGDFLTNANLADMLGVTRRRLIALAKRLNEFSDPLAEPPDPFTNGQSNGGGMYEKIVDAASGIMASDFASLQMLFPERGTAGELRLLSFRGFNPEAARFWEWVRADSKSTCGLALLTGERAIAPEIARCEFMADSEDQLTYLQTGIHACQTTPLIARTGQLVGMISTHWRTPHLPSERDLRLFDILARQTADLIDRCRSESFTYRSSSRLRRRTG
ncbi:MAG TPA: GAF domain-containing protein [Candidatus Angelobacter sp.]|nr:GAF domain-containing protein [Candidatus Angelobacter sp.]